MKIIQKIATLGFSALAAGSLTASAATIAINNGDFELFFTDSSQTTPIVLNDFEYTLGFQTTGTDGFSIAGFVPGWSDTPHDAYTFGLDNRTVAPFPSAIFGNYAYSDSAGTLEQTLSTTVADFSTYTLTLQVANDQGKTYADPTVELLVGGVALTPTAFTTTSPADDAIENWSFTYVTGDVVNTDFLGIRITNTADAFAIDNVALDVSPVPEPSTYVLLLGGLGVLVGLRHFRRRSA